MADKETVEIPAPTTAGSGSIKAITKDTVHKICSGQVVLSLAVAVKELVENAIDAGATLVEVKLRDQGLESVEVCDNGSGVEEHNLEGMTAKYHTSKIREFFDLQSVETFGFRGEALSSLCALSDMVVKTRHKSKETGIKIELNHDGKIKKRMPCARGIGTTVILSNLFATLPVRRRDFIRNIKKEFSKMCQILQAYCLVSKGVRIICSNQTPKGAKTVILQTHGSNDVLSNISSLFGSRQMAEIVALKSAFELGKLSEDSLRTELQSDAGDTTQISAEDIERLNAAEFELEGFVSTCSHGCGRSTKDRQFFFVNSRPCEPKNISKVMNEVYHRYNVHQYPFVYLNVLTPRTDVDVNLTPDKRQLLINNEKILLLGLKKALLNTYGNIPSTFKLQNSTITTMLETKKETEKKMNMDTADTDTKSVLPITSSQRFMDVLTQWKHTGDTKGIAPHVPTKRKCSDDEISTRTLKLQKIQEFLTKENPSHGASYKSDEDSNKEEIKQTKKNSEPIIKNETINISMMHQETKDFESGTQSANEQPIVKTIESIDCQILTPSKMRQMIIESTPPDGKNINDESLKLSQVSVTSTETNDSQVNDDEDVKYTIQPSLQTSSNIKTVEFDDSTSETEFKNFPCGELRTTLAEIELDQQAEDNIRKERSKKSKLDRLRFKSEINPNGNQNAEAELQKEIGKNDFARMEIIGQFNLGFIIVKLDDDVFIVDQHATDEKYNFEILQQTTTLEYQKLAVPQTLELTAVNEMILLDNIGVFEKNGFKFEINKNAPSTKKIRLLGKPTSKNWQFGKEDIDELIFMLQDAPEGTICRPTRIRAMFASRACRKSVMIGKALNKGTMQRLIMHMGEIEQPWNCPHGRPTIRHLINIAMLTDDGEVEQ